MLHERLALLADLDSAQFGPTKLNAIPDGVAVYSLFRTSHLAIAFPKQSELFANVTSSLQSLVERDSIFRWVPERICRGVRACHTCYRTADG